MCVSLCNEHFAVCLFCLFVSELAKDCIEGKNRQQSMCDSEEHFVVCLFCLFLNWPRIALKGRTDNRVCVSLFVNFFILFFCMCFELVKDCFEERTDTLVTIFRVCLIFGTVVFSVFHVAEAPKVH